MPHCASQTLAPAIAIKPAPAGASNITPIRHLPIDQWPKQKRPREKLLRDGTSTLGDSELLAIVLRMGCRGQSAVDLGQALLSRFGSIHGLLSASPKEIRAVHGIGPAKLAQLQVILELARRTLTEQLRDATALDSPDMVRNYLRLFIGVRTYEVFVCLYLDSKHRLLRTVEASRGTLTHTAVYPREIAREALALNAASLIVAHNHPSGDIRPSTADRQLTQKLSETLQLIEVKLLDHLIVGENAVFSFAERGLL